MSYTRKVREFSKACSEHLPEHPQLMSAEKIAFTQRMVQDEMDELDQAETIVEQADALIDTIYYLCDSAVRHGLDLDPLFDIVHEANMQKVRNSKIIRREDGKILKPDGWQDPRVKLEAEIQRQGRSGSFPRT